MTMKKRLALLAAASLITLAACSRNDEATENEVAADDAPAAVTADDTDAPDALAGANNTAAEEEPVSGDPVAAAVNHPDRSASDKENDARRKAAETLAFFDIEPGDSVFEIEAGGGWYTELLSRLVGPGGEVVMQNPEGFLAYVGEDINARLAGDRLPNVRQSISVFDDLDAEDASMDAVTWVQGPHELYYTPEDGSNLGDPAASWAEIFRILKPGGVFTVIDHRATAGAPETTGHDLHRIDPGIIKGMAAQAGLVVDAESDILANPDDDHDMVVFDPSVRGNTDQFMIRFRKAS